MLHLLGQFPFGFRLSGVILPKMSPPSFAIPFFESHWFPHEPTTYLPRSVLIQDICNSQVTAFARVELDESVKTISARQIKTLSLESGEYDISHLGWGEFDAPVFLTSSKRLYAFVESPRIVRLGHMEPLRECLSHLPMLQNNDAKRFPISNFESEGNHFTILEIARFQRSRQNCLDALRSCFGLLEQHNRSLAVHWLEMTKGSLKSEGILESTD
jgi:hypothetical protein